MIKIIGLIRTDRFLNSGKIAAKYHHILSKYDFDSCESVAMYMSAYKKREIIPRNWYGRGKKIMFEDSKVVGVYEQEKYLSRIYGAYMTLPPEEKRVGKHNTVLLKKANQHNGVAV